MNAIKKTIGGVSALVALAVVVGLNMGGCGGVADPAAEKQFMQVLGETTVTVFPTCVREGKQLRDDADSAARIRAFLEDENLAKAVRSDVHVPITSEWGMNQARMFRDSAADFAAFVKANPIDTEYAVMAEYLFGKSEAGGVHVYVVRKDGVIAYGSLWNSHQKVFSDVSPRTVDECTDVLLAGLRVDLEQAE